MSLSTTAMITVEPTRRQLLQEAVQRAASQGLLDLARRGIASEIESVQCAHAAELEARVEAVRADALAREAIIALEPSLVDASDRSLASIHDAVRLGDYTRADALALDADANLCRGILQAGNSAARAERAEAASIVARALESIGGYVTQAANDRESTVWAELDHQIVAAVVEGGGRTRIDYAGCHTGACAPLHEELRSALIAEGAVLEHVRTFQHGRAEGGDLIRQAGRVAAGHGDMADALLRRAEAKPAASDSALQAAQAAQQRTA